VASGVVTRRAVVVLVALGAVAVGIGAEVVRFAWDEPVLWLPDLVVGWTMVACGLIAIWRQPSGTGMLLVGAGLAWFLGNYAAVDSPRVAWLAAHAVYLHRGVLIHAVLAFPGWRPPTIASLAAVAIGYASSLITPVARNPVAVILVSAIVIMAAWWDLRVAIGPSRRIQVIVLRAAVWLGLTLSGAALAPLMLPWPGAGRAILLTYDAALVALTVGLLVALILASWERTGVIDLVVELAAGRAASVDASLGRALGDPSLRVGYWLADRDRYVDAAGRQVNLPGPDSGRAVTPVEWEGARIAVLIHDPAVTAGSGLGESVSTAAALAAANARLQAQVRDRVAQVQASRRRLVGAGADERRRLEGRMRAGAGSRLDEVAYLLRAADDGVVFAQETELVAKIERARRQLDRTREELSELGRGLYPPALTERGLAAALSELAEHSAIPVKLTVSANEVPAEIAAVAYFVVAEALSNVAKHAEATEVTVTVAVQDARLLVELIDDGIGGANPDEGSGLRGLADRVEALDGSFQLASPAGAGTRLAAEMPLTGQPHQRSGDLDVPAFGEESLPGFNTTV
jgi:Histidine kinase-, DNA gyrase B-, and HSP90-like ATPase